MPRHPSIVLNTKEKEIVSSNIGLAYRFAKKYFKSSHYEDILSECFVALCYAAKRWDNVRPFSTYAWRKMLSRCCRVLEKVDNTASLLDDPGIAYTASNIIDFTSVLQQDKDGNLLIKKYLNGNTTEDLSKEIGCTQSGVRNRIRKSIKRIREQNEWRDFF